MTTAPREVGGQDGGVFDVVEDQQPARAGAQLTQQHLHGVGRGCAGRRRADTGGELGQLIGDQGGILGGDPPGQFVLAGEAVRVFDGELGLTDPAPSVQRLNGDTTAGRQGLT
ncbi:hypothetical protein GCM10010448_23610 [Streptomyces glomeratus]|uniref:Uncharacterized protein n=1 Tax=Streptomyces glomeratus TaxID=284452 RepID=A0ABP6LFQ2_9ACTN